METLIIATLIIIFFLFALLNSTISHSSKLLPWLQSFLSSANPNPPKPINNPSAYSDYESDLKSLFSTFDSDGDGFISKIELTESLRRLGIRSSGTEIARMMEKADINGDGFVDYHEFRELCFSWGIAIGNGGEGEEELREAFAVFDGNGDGLITVEELRMVLRSLGLKDWEEAESCREMIKNVDIDGDGMINFDEFKIMMKKTKSQNIF